MKILLKILTILIIFPFSHQCIADSKLVACGKEWVNIHKDNPGLLGIHVQQLPDDIESQKDYIGNHPVMVIYIFKNNRAHTITYTPTGQVQNGVWWDIPEVHWAKESLVADKKENFECVYWLNSNRNDTKGSSLQKSKEGDKH